MEHKIADLEKELDTFSLVLLREQAQLEFERQHKSAAEAESNSARGWFSGWFSSSKPTTDSEKYAAEIGELQKAS